MNTPLPAYPAQSGVISGAVLTPDEIAEMDQRIVWDRVLPRRKITLAMPCDVLIGHRMHRGETGRVV